MFRLHAPKPHIVNSEYEDDTLALSLLQDMTMDIEKNHRNGFILSHILKSKHYITRTGLVEHPNSTYVDLHWAIVPVKDPAEQRCWH